MGYPKRTHIYNPADIPNEPHLAIVEKFTYTDESWGEPKTESGLRYVIYEDEEEWKAEIIKLFNGNKDFKAIRSRGLAFEIKVEVETNIKEV